MSQPQTQADLVALLSSKGVVRDERVRTALLATDRAIYVAHKPASTLRTGAGASKGFKALSYWDRAMGLGFGATISAPRIHAMALELLKDHLTEGKRVLDVGCGSGYLTACMGRMVGPSGAVIGLEHIPELAVNALDKIAADDATLLRRKTVLTADADAANIGDATEEEIVSGDRGCITIVAGDGRKGYPKAAPYDVIYVGAAATELPTSLLQQLAPGGRLLCPVGPEATPRDIETDNANHTLVAVDKSSDGTLKKKGIMGVIFIPLTDATNQLTRK